MTETGSSGPLTLREFAALWAIGVGALAMAWTTGSYAVGWLIFLMLCVTSVVEIDARRREPLRDLE
ncbi:MAG: hypothetical protein ABEH56_04730 [Salinirussus sp.]